MLQGMTKQLSTNKERDFVVANSSKGCSNPEHWISSFSQDLPTMGDVKPSDGQRCNAAQHLQRLDAVG
jgi:predicted alpha/beta hydrolase family esterase